MKKLKETCNSRDQDSRSTVIRVFNFPVSETESADGNKGLSNKVYDRVIKPVLAAAKNKGELAALPQLQTILTECFRTRSAVTSSSGGTPPPPPVILKLSSSIYKVAIMRNKRDNIPQTTGSSPIFITEDLTPDTHSKMMDLKQDKRVSKVWTVNGQIRLTLASSPQRVVKVKSVYEDSEKILSK